MDMFIENSTDDDTTVKVYPTPPPREDRPPKEVKGPVKEVIVRAGSKQKLSLPSSCMVHFEVEVCKYEVKPPAGSRATPAPKRLTLTKVPNDGYKVSPDTKA